MDFKLVFFISISSYRLATSMFLRRSYRIYGNGSDTCPRYRSAFRAWHECVRPNFGGGRRKLAFGIQKLNGYLTWPEMYISELYNFDIGRLYTSPIHLFDGGSILHFHWIHRYSFNLLFYFVLSWSVEIPHLLSCLELGTYLTKGSYIPVKLDI